jgi:acyl carrier protein
MRRGVKEAVAAIQQIIVETLELDVKPTDLDPDREFPALECMRDGEVRGIDSMDFVDIVGVLEERLDAELLEDVDFRKTGGTGGTIRKVAKFLVSEFGATRIRALSGPTD